MKTGDGVKERAVATEKGEPRMKDVDHNGTKPRASRGVKSSVRTPRPTITTRQRVEQAVEQHSRSDDWGVAVVSSDEVIKLILAERRRIARQVRKLRLTAQRPCETHEEAIEQLGYMGACDDMLARLRG